VTLLVAWLAFPLVLSALCLGCGLLVERASGSRLPGALLVPVGLALIVALTQVATYRDATAELATPLVLAAAVGGVATSASRLRTARIDGWAAGAAVAVFAVFAAPVVLSGEATFAGYTLLGDTSIHFVLIDRLMEHGRDLSGLEPSSYRSALEAYFDTAYPQGSQTALGAVRPLVGQDVAWVFQPFLACLAALTSLALYTLAAPAIERAPVRALAAFVAAQPALVFAFSLQGSVKEMAAVAVLATLVALVPVFLGGSARVRSVVPAAVVAAAGIGVLGLAIAPWLGLIAVAGLVAAYWQRRSAPMGGETSPGAVAGANRLTLLQCGAFCALAAALAFPSLVETGDFLHVTSEVATAPNELGNLVGPLNELQAVGIWPVGDYRLSPTGASEVAGYLLIGLAIAAAILGAGWMLHRRALAPLLFLGVSLVAGSYVLLRGSPWVDAKALMIASPAVMLAALIGAAALLAKGRRVEAALLATALAFGVVWSNALAYRAVRLAPRDRLAQLQDIGEQLAGEGPTLYTEFEEFGKHFLREGDPTGSSEAWQPPTPTGERGRFDRSEDLDRFSLAYVLRYRTIVLRRSPSLSRPPSPFKRISAGSYYEVWRRRSPPRPATEHIPLGGSVQPAARPDCDRLREVADEARRRHRLLAYVARPRVLAAAPGVREPAAAGSRGPGLSLWSTGGSSLEGVVRPRSPGERRVWLEGSFGRGYEVRIDGRPIGTASYELNGPDQYAYVGEVALPPGRHEIRISLAGVSVHPGNGSGDRRLRRMVVSPIAGEDRRVRYLEPARFRALCNRDLDWVEAVHFG
jgi:hypothetical protein